MAVWLERLLGLIFIAGAALKAVDMDAFQLQIAQYHVIEQHGLIIAASWITLGIETALGILLILSWRLGGLTHAAVLGLLAVFTGLIAYAWRYHDLADCGCFGAFLQMTPGMSIGKNVAMMAMSGGAWYLGTKPTEPRGSGAFAKGLVAAVCVVLVGGAAVYGAQQNGGGPAQQASAPSAEADASRPFSQFNFTVNGETYDLGSGEYLVAFFSATCEHCMDEAPKLNEWTYFPELPPVLAIMMGNASEIEEFRIITGIEYPTVSVKPLVFFDFVDPAPPAFYYIDKGLAVTEWGDTAPGVDTVLETVMAHQADSGA